MNPKFVSNKLRALQDRPFYLHVGFTDPHRSGGGFGNEKPYTDIPEQSYRPDEVVVPPFLPDVPEVRADLADYYQAVSRYDFNIGCLLDVLEESGRADETLVVVTTDHAMPFPGAKASFFDSGHHCPFILRAPGLERPPASDQYCRSQALFNWTDIRPTLQDWCGVEVPNDLPGRSILPALANPQPAGWDETYFSHCFHEIVDYNPYRVLRGRRYKFVRNLAAGLTTLLPTDLFRSTTWTAVRQQGIETMGQRPTRHVQERAPEELYDVQQDPTESRNLIGDPALEQVAQTMRQQLDQFRRDTGDPWLEVDFQEGRSDGLNPR
ncbi:MAG: sulfatase-like hydrolase/transferase [Candidatus Latescibacteria bacterium]|nr:sulfatase-like hydrolase/transferase [Candidatus Latescibacterota bacterium]